MIAYWFITSGGINCLNNMIRVLDNRLHETQWCKINEKKKKGQREEMRNF